MPRTLLLLLTSILLLALGVADAAERPAADTVPVPDSIVVQNVPAIPQSAIEGLAPYENIRAAALHRWHPTARRMLITTRFAESSQLHEVAMPLGQRTQLTFYRDPVPNGAYRPGHPDEILFTLNQGGAENFQFFLLDRTNGRSRRVTDGTHRYVTPRWSHSGQLLAYLNNARNGRDFDLYVADPSTAGSERKVAELSGSWEALDWSADDKRLLLHEQISANESYLHWVDVGEGKVHAITPRATAGAETVAYENGRWAKDGKAVFTTTDQGSEFRRLVRLDVASGKIRVLSGKEPWDVEGFDVSDDGALVAYFVNHEGMSRLHVVRPATGAQIAVPKLPDGVAGGIEFRPHSHEIGFTMSSAESPSDVYSLDLASPKLVRWTASETGGLNPKSFAAAHLVRYPTFDQDEHRKTRTIPAFVYYPPADRFPGPRPVVLSIHGGPEGQARPAFQGGNSYLVNELGVVLVYPNVRGSSGYGKGYLKLDNGEKREDSVKDIGALLDWVKTQPALDASRVMVSGGSYGGYMTLATLTFYSDRLRCGFDTVGISNFVTFLKNTQEYRRDLRRVEYGDERDPKMREFLERISPANHADRIKVPLLVAAGANDPRVPVTESDQIVAAIKKNNVPVWYVVAKDEGHGYQKKSNTDYLRAAEIAFIREHLLAGGGTAKGGSR
ncbi:MAG TPA: prolyl oligopeptidase family serine peptidase [Thermoanaerobaculia bacterium]